MDMFTLTSKSSLNSNFCLAEMYCLYLYSRPPLCFVVFLCANVFVSNAYVKVLFAAILPLPFVTLHQKKKMQAWPVF